MIGWLVGLLNDWVVSSMVSWFIVWLVGLIVGWVVGLLNGWVVSSMISWFIGWLVGLIVSWVGSWFIE